MVGNYKVVRYSSHQEIKVYRVNLGMCKVWKLHAMSSVMQNY